MLLLHQAGSVKIGEVIRYTVTYTPANDRILPSPPHLYLRIKNTSNVALRAAFIHGPYALYVSSAPSTFSPNEKFEQPRYYGVPEFEPNLKAGGTWYSQLTIPEYVRQSAGTSHTHADGERKSVSWVVEIASQVIFSNSAAVHYEVLLGRDEKSLSLGMMGGSSHGGIPGQVSDHQQSQGAHDGHHPAQQKGVFSRAIELSVDDTASLWNKPKMPEWDDQGKDRAKEPSAGAPMENTRDRRDDHRNKRQKKVHLVVLTHGLHSNLGADMLYMKESIDEAAEQARKDARARRLRRAAPASGNFEKAPAQNHEDNTDVDEDDEEVIVRGFSGNAVRTEKGIKYLGKRLAKYVLAMTYPDQPYLPITKSSTAHNLAQAVKHEKNDQGQPAHNHSSIHRESAKSKPLAYKITSISFIAHSLGGLIQMYAVAYIQKHSPQFFDNIKPVNFIALASPFLGLSNENPIYVKFALDFGLVGRTGQDLGLTWRAPNLARTGWGAIVGGISENAHKKIEGQPDPRAKPLLRILPTGPAHLALKKFRNRTVYSNVVNDGIVPLRTSCLLFLDWSGLGRVEKARRDNGLVGTMAGWGWAELTGFNSGAPRLPLNKGQDDAHRDAETSQTPESTQDQTVPQPPDNATDDDDARSLKGITKGPDSMSFVPDEHGLVHRDSPTATATNNGGALDSILGLFRSHASPKSHNHCTKQSKIYKRSQTMNFNSDSESDVPTTNRATAGDVTDQAKNMSAPPKTTFFESAGDLLNPPIPPIEFLVDPTLRPRTIFHDRVYHPGDIPPPPLKRRSTSRLLRRSSSGFTPSLHSHASSLSDDDRQVVDDSAMKVEEKIARAYHNDLSWRKVLVRLEPDAHNNMIVRRKFANAYGWPVVKHLVDTHFSDSVAANTRDEDEGTQERAKSSEKQPDSTGDEMERGETDDRPVNPGESDLHDLDRTMSEVRESRDEVPAMSNSRPSNMVSALDSARATAASGSDPKGGNNPRPRYKDRADSAQWSDRDWADSDGDSDGEQDREEAKSTSTSTTNANNIGSSSWNWTEVVAGKGPRSPRSSKKSELERSAMLDASSNNNNRFLQQMNHEPFGGRTPTGSVRPMSSGTPPSAPLQQMSIDVPHDGEPDALD